MSAVPEHPTPLDGQNVVRSRDLRAVGVSARTEHRRVASGLWDHPVAGIVAVGPLAPLDLARAALLHAGEDARLSRQSAAQWLLRRPFTAPLHLDVPHGHRVRPMAGVVVHQDRRRDAWALWEGLPVVPPALAAAQVCAATDLPEPDRRALATALVQTGLATCAAVAERAAGTALRVRAQVRRTVEELVAGAHSEPEADLWRRQVEARMPVPLLNHPLDGGRYVLDGYLPDLRAGYEVQSRAHHSETWAADTRRLSAVLLRHRTPLLMILAADLRSSPGGVLADLATFWRQRAEELGVPLPPSAPPPRWTPVR